MMWDKIFLLILAVCSAIMAGLTYYSWSWLQSIGNPAATVEGYTYHAGLAWTFLWISSIVLLVAANFLLGRFRRSWAMWATFVYFAAFAVIRYFFLERSFLHYKLNAGFGEPGISWAPFAGAIIVIAAGATVFLNHLLVVRLREQLYPAAAADEVVTSKADDQPSDEEH